MWQYWGQLRIENQTKKKQEKNGKRIKTESIYKLPKCKVWGFSN